MNNVKGGMRVGADNRVHTTFTHNPSTLRLSSTSPNLQNIPRGGTEVQGWVKDMFVAAPGHVLIEADYSAIEAVLVGYFANSPHYMRFAKLGVHAYFTSHLVGRPTDLEQTDDTLREIFRTLKKEENDTYQVAKRVVHLSNYRGTPRRMQEEYPDAFRTIQAAAQLQRTYYALFPEISRWHTNLTNEVDGARRRDADEGETVTPWTLGSTEAQNPFGYLHRFFRGLEWKNVEGEWVSSFGEDARRLIAFLPQSTAAAVIKRVIRRLWEDEPTVAPYLRLCVHDSILLEVPENEAEWVTAVLTKVMCEPIPELPLDPTWGMGSHLTIGVEVKSGKTWSAM